MKVTTGTISVVKIIKDHKNKKLNFDMKIQRSEDIWDKKRRSKMIHSMMINWPTSSIFASKDNNILSIVDGKQRFTTPLSFISGKFALDKTTPDVNGINVQGKKFTDLPEELQNKILQYEFKTTIVQEATLEELEELFFRLNSGMPMRKIETTRAILGGRVLKLVEDVANTPFFQLKANISNISKKRFLDQELVLQILAMIHKKETGFSGNEIEAFVLELKNQRIQEELKSKMQNASFYLNQVYLKKEKYLRKTHIPILFKLVLELQEKAVVITPTEFEEWSTKFFSNMPINYVNASQSGNAKKENVQTRYKEMKAHFNSHMTKLNKEKAKSSAS